MEKLDVLLSFLEENLDVEHIRKVEQLHLDVLEYKQVPFLPLALVFPTEDFTLFPLEEAYNDPEKMLYNELISTIRGSGAYNSVKLKDYFPPHIRSNHGIGILSSLFGAKCKLINNNMPWVEHLELDEIKKAISKGVPDFDQALGKRVIETHRHYIDRLKEYPKCFQCIRVTQPDLQGPFDIAHLLIGEDIFYGVYDYPELIHELLQIITQTYIGFKRKLDSLVTDRAGDNAIYLHGCIFGGNTLIKDDTGAINLSEEMYIEFSKKYNDEIFEAFGGGSIHFCGRSSKWTAQRMDNKWLMGINYGNPEKQDLNSVYKFWSERKVPNLLWGDVLCLYRQDHDFLEEIHRLKINTGMSLMLRADSFEEAQSVLKRHMEYQAAE